MRECGNYIFYLSINDVFIISSCNYPNNHFISCLFSFLFYCLFLFLILFFFLAFYLWSFEGFFFLRRCQGLAGRYEVNEICRHHYFTECGKCGHSPHKVPALAAHDQSHASLLMMTFQLTVVTMAQIIKFHRHSIMVHI